MSGRVAMCWSCEDEPLVMTFARPGFEFTCLSCGAWYTFMQPRGAEETPERVAKMEERKTRYAATLPDPLSSPGVLSEDPEGAQP